MRKFINEVSYSALLGLIRIRRVILKYIVNTRFGYLIAGLIIGMTSIIIFNEVSSHNYFSIKKVVYQAEVSRGSESGYKGDVVSTASYQPIEQDEFKSSNSGENILNASSKNIALINKIRKSFPECPDLAVEIAKCESSLNPNRIGDTHMKKWSYGLFQINQTWHNYSKEILLNEDENIKIARKIYDNNGRNWNRWTCGRILTEGKI